MLRLRPVVSTTTPISSVSASCDLYWLFYHFFFDFTCTTVADLFSLPDALPIFTDTTNLRTFVAQICADKGSQICRIGKDLKSTRLNSSHLGISYAVFCLKKKKQATGAEGVSSRYNPGVN